MLPSQYPELLDGSPNLREMLQIQVDMQFADVRSLLQLPIGDLEAGCNLTLANLLFVLIAGSSAMFLDAELAYFRKYGGSGKRFTRIMRNFYPWDRDADLTPAESANLLYRYARNPLTHSFGIGKAAHLFPGAPQTAKQAIWLGKRPLTAAQADEVLRGQPARPVFLPPTLSLQPGGVELFVPTLAWGTARTLRRLFEDATQLSKAEALAAQFLQGG